MGLTTYYTASASRGPVFRWYPLNGWIDQNKTWVQEVSALIFRNIVLSQKKSKISESCHWPVMLNMEPTLFRQSSSRAKVTDTRRDLGCEPWSIHQPRRPYQTGTPAFAAKSIYEWVVYYAMMQFLTLGPNGKTPKFWFFCYKGILGKNRSHAETSLCQSFVLIYFSL